MPITQETLLLWLVVGVVAGGLANQVMKGSGYGVVEDVVIGMLGAVAAGHLFRTLAFDPLRSWLPRSARLFSCS